MQNEQSFNKTFFLSRSILQGWGYTDVSLLLVSICQTKRRGLGSFEPVWNPGCPTTIRRRDDQAERTEN